MFMKHGVAATQVLCGIILCALSTGCQPDQKPVVSLDQARQVQAQFAGQAAFVPPPRSISDVTAILDLYKPDPAQLNALRIKVETQPLPTLSPALAYAFFLDRGRAAGELGLFVQQVSDLTQAARLAEEHGLDGTIALENLQDAEGTVGNTRRALELGIKRLAEAEKFRRGGNVLGSWTSISYQRAVLGDLQGAETALANARQTLSSSQFRQSSQFNLKYPGWQAGVQRATAQLAMATGHYQEAETELRKSLSNTFLMQDRESQVRSVDPDVPAGAWQRTEMNTRNRIAQSLRSQSRLIEAEVEMRIALTTGLKQYGRSDPGVTSLVVNLAEILTLQGRFDEARALLAKALEVYEKVGIEKNSRFVANTHALMAVSFDATNQFSDSIKAWEKALAVYAGDENEQFTRVKSRLEYVISHVEAARAGDVLPVAIRNVADRRQRFGDRHYGTAEARGVLGMVLFHTGRSDEALVELRTAVPILLQTSRQAEDGSVSARDRRLQRIFETYIEILATKKAGEIPGLDPIAESFMVADAARARGVQRAIAESAARATLRDPSLSDLVRREQDAQKQISALFGVYTNALASTPDQRNPEALNILRLQIDQLRGARSVLRQEIERRFPDYASLIDPRPATVAEVQAQLRPGEALLSIYVGAHKTFVWAVPKQGSTSFSAVALNEKEIAQAVADLRKALDPNAATLGDIPPFDVVSANRLYRQLIQPVAAGLQGASSLLVVPDKGLGQLPFGLLVTQPTQPVADDNGALFSAYKRVPFLIRQKAVTQLPSITALATLRRVPAGNPSRKAFAGFGDPLFSLAQAQQAQTEAQTQIASLTTRGIQTRGIPLKRRNAPSTNGIDSAELAMLPRLPDTADEVRSIAVALKADPMLDIFLGAAANERQVKTLNLADRKVIMFATHGLIPGDLNGLSQPALAMSAPAVANIDGDGLLTMEEILGLQLDADWIVLSACNTAAGDGAGAEAASGLGLAFFYAGTRAVLLTNWPVETTSARELTTDLFRRQASDPDLSRSTAMQQAMIAMIDGDGFVDQGKSVFSYAHPIFWAPFSVVGDGGDGKPGS
jgi:CHAT domain-containing protein